MSSNWINHVKQFQEQNGCSYKDALKKSKGSYQRGGHTDQPQTLGDFFDDEKFPTDHPFWSIGNSKKKKSKKIAPMLVNDQSPVANNPFNPPVEEKKSKKPKKGSDAWYKKKEESSSNYLKDLINRIEKQDGRYGKEKYKKAYKASDIDRMGRKKGTKVAEDEVKINKKKKKPNKINQLLKAEKNKYKKLFLENQNENAKCKPNQTYVKSYCRKTRRS